MTAEPKNSQRLNRTDWIEAAMRLLVEDGPEALRVDRLCVALGVTKGSFYWHFAGRDALIEAMAADWAERRPGEAIDEAATRNTPKERLQLLSLSFWRDDIVRYDAAMRAWGIAEQRVRAAVEATDRQIVRFIEAQFEAMGHEAAEARARARILFYSGVGVSAAPYLIDRKDTAALARMSALLLEA